MEKINQDHMEYLPKPRFEIVSVDDEVKALAYFLQSMRWKDTFYNEFPELKELPVSEYRNFLEKQHELKKDKLIAAQQKLETVWGEIGPEFMGTLATHFETSWPEDKVPHGVVSVLPVFPRDLDMYAFYVGYKSDVSTIETAAHEMLHFLWFKKWNEVFPDMDHEEYNSPHLAWRLSEIMDPIILQCNAKIKELIKPKLWGYSTFKNVTIEGISMVEYFKHIYEENVAAGKSFEQILKILWEEAQKHEEEISQF